MRKRIGFFRIFVTMKSHVLSILLAISTSLGCSAQRGGTVYEPVRYEDGTVVEG